MKERNKSGKPYVYYKSLTASLKDLEKGEIMLIIKLLPNGKTKAHEIFHIYNHADEYQVNFERETAFKVISVKNGKRPIVYLEEI